LQPKKLVAEVCISANGSKLNLISLMRVKVLQSTTAAKKRYTHTRPEIGLKVIYLWLGGRYPDDPPENRPDESWKYRGTGLSARKRDAAPGDVLDARQLSRRKVSITTNNHTHIYKFGRKLQMIIARASVSLSVWLFQPKGVFHPRDTK